jgi:hypothetical protein
VPATVPSPPTIGVASSGNASIVVNFTPPANNGGSGVTGYSATCTSTDGGIPGTNTGSAPPITVTGLTNGKTYTCRVAATNAVGTSAPSAPSAPVNLGVPAPPIVVDVRPGSTLSTTGTLTVFFTAGAGNGSPSHFRYTVSCISTNGGTARANNGATSPITVPGLTTGAKYICTVTATNVNGTSLPSLPGRGTVGAPAPPVILRVLSLPNGVAIAVQAGASNGSAVISFRARCTSTNGGLPGNPLQIVSPIIVSSLTPGATYTCSVSANNLRGEGPARVSAPAIVGTSYKKASCSGHAGSVVATHGLFLAQAKPQTLTLAATMSTCSGPYVSAGRMNASFRSATAITCRTATQTTNGGSGKLTWTAPLGMGSGAATLRFVFVSSSGHTTQVHIYGDVTSRPNLFTGRHVNGSITLNKGLKAVAAGGNCTALIPLTSFGITAIAFTIS